MQYANDEVLFKCILIRREIMPVHVGLIRFGDILHLSFIL